jgi:hypothetical protein
MRWFSYQPHVHSFSQVQPNTHQIRLQSVSQLQQTPVSQPQQSNDSIDTDSSQSNQSEQIDDQNVLQDIEYINSYFELHEIETRQLVNQHFTSSGHGEFLLPMELVQQSAGENLQMKLWNLIFWGYGPGDYLLEQMNEKRQQRLQSRQQKEGTRGREPKLSSNGSLVTYWIRRTKYLKKWKKPFTKEDFNKFLSCLFEMSNVKLSTVKDYFRTPSINEQGSFYFKRRLSYEKFIEMFNCLSGDVDFLTDSSNVTFGCIYQASKEITIDESMVPDYSRRNPHHHFVKRKPHPHGPKFITAADSDSFLLHFKLHKRAVVEDEEPALKRSKNTYERGEKLPTWHVEEMVDEMINNVKQPSIICTDSYYSCMKTIELVLSKGHDFVGSCRIDRPKEFFKEGLNDVEPDENGIKIAQGTFPIGGKRIPFTVSQMSDVGTVSRKRKRNDDGSWEISEEQESKNRTINIFSSLNHGNSVVRNTCETFLDNEYVQKERIVTKDYAHYLRQMGSVDRVNKSIMDVYYRHRKTRWRLTIILWIIYAFVHNIRIIYNSLVDASKKMNQKEFIKSLARGIYPVESINGHQLVKCPRSSCVICYSIKKDCNTARSSTEWRCTGCGPMHKKCFSSTNHLAFVLKKYEK